MCEFGYDGPMCQSCINNETIKYSKKGNFCEMCNDKVFSIMELIIALGVSFLIICMQIKFLLIFIKTSIFFSFRLILKIMDRDRKKENYSRNNFVIGCISILLGHFQIMPLLKKINFNWQNAISSFLSIQSVLGNTSESVNSLDCLIISNFNFIFFIYIYNIPFIRNS